MVECRPYGVSEAPEQRERQWHPGASQPAAGKAGEAPGCIIGGQVSAARELTSMLPVTCQTTCGALHPVRGLALGGRQGHTGQQAPRGC